jgi:hypothetical protein
MLPQSHEALPGPGHTFILRFLEIRTDVYLKLQARSRRQSLIIRTPFGGNI